ncbi:CBS domain-containing protein [Rhizobium leguminosarum bv. viciae]|nr:CBS domain-containing protein [Rhizobium leguminosarum bv. viciae]
MTARDVMSSEAVFCHMDDRIEEAIHRMEAHQVRRLPALNKENRVVGMLSMATYCIAGEQTLWRGICYVDQCPSR